MIVDTSMDLLAESLIPLAFSVLIYLLAYRIVARGFHWLEECSPPACDQQRPEPDDREGEAETPRRDGIPRGAPPV